MNRFLLQVYSSCTDFPFYKTIVRQKMFSTIQYFVILLFLVALITTGVYYFYFKAGANLLVDWAVKHLPEISIREGIVSSPVSQPYTAIDDNFIFILDTTGEVDRLDPQITTGVLVMKDRVWIKRKGMETQDIDLSWIKELDLNAYIVSTWKDKIIPLMMPLVFIFSLIGLLLSKMIQAFMFSFMVSLFYPEEKSGLGLQELFNLCVYAATPAILIGLLVQVLHLQIPLFWWIYFAMYAAFFIGAFMQCRSKKEKEPEIFIE